MISSLVFLRRGVAAENPTIYKMTDEEYTRLQELAGEQVDLAKEELDAAKAAEKAGVTMDTDGSDESDDEEDSDEEVAHAKKAAKVIKAAAQTGKPTDPSDLAEYNLDDYDGDGDAPESRLFSNISALSVPAAADPYLDLTGEDSDEEDLRMLPSDSMIVAARTEDDLSQVEVYVYERGESNLYVRNDWMVPGMPLCMEWLDFGPGGEKGGILGDFFCSCPFNLLTCSFYQARISHSARTTPSLSSGTSISSTASSPS
jgi:periodic tryptophan protein 1